MIGQDRLRLTCRRSHSVMLAVCWAITPCLPVYAATPAQLLMQIQKAAESTDYSGTFLYQQGNVMITSRVTHVVDGEGVKERLEVLDGDAQEYLRNNNVVESLIPARKMVIVDKPRKDRFPALLLGPIDNLEKYYDIRAKNGSTRVAGRPCDMIEVHPRVQDRYGYRFCADEKSRLLLKSQTVNEQGTVIEQVTFTGLSVGSNVDTANLKSAFDYAQWKRVEHKPVAVDLTLEGWRIRYPAGFAPIMSIVRPKGTKENVKQLILTDGLSSISVFIQKVKDSEKTFNNQGDARVGSMNVFRQRIDDYWLTAIGAIPLTTLKDLAVSTKFIQPVSKQ